MTIYMSSGAFRARTLPQVVKDSVRLGITHVELSSGLAHEPDVETSITKGMESGLTFLVHNYFPAPEEPQVLNLTAGDPEGLAWSINHCRYALDLSVKVGGAFYSLHSGFAAPLKASMLGKPDLQAAAMKNTPIDREASYHLMIRTVREVADYAAARGKSLLLENNVISPVYLEKSPVNPLLMTHHDEINRFMADVGRANVGFLIDTGHAKVSGTALGFDPQDFIAAIKPHIRAFHLSDNDGREDQNLPFTNKAWFYPLLKDFAPLPMVIEAYKLDDAAMLSQRDLLRRAIN